MRFKSIDFHYRDLHLSVLAAVDLDSQLRSDLDPDRIPYWSVVWESAFALARWIGDRGGWAGTPVLELGCGVGLAGLAAAALGARVTQTDLFLDAVALARENAVLNGLRRVEQYAGDWRAWSVPGAWPVVIGSDLTYERSSHQPLLAVLERVVEPGGRVHLADPGRPMTLDFMVLAEGAGWSVEIATAPGDGDVREVFVYTLFRRRSRSHPAHTVRRPPSTDRRR